MKKNIIKFTSSSDHVFEVRERPQPAAKYIPDWWKQIPKYTEPQNKLELIPKANVTVKQCAPVLDIFSSGYIIPLWSDIVVNQSPDGVTINWATELPVMDSWSISQSSLFKPPVGFDKIAFKYLHGWNIKTPPGWSCLFIHPVAYQDLPIRSISGIVDTDILDGLINCPFFIQKGFEGIIEKGTPMVQVIPFKRDSWESKIEKEHNSKHFFNHEKISTKIYGYYSSLRERKNYK
jgi:hypothetical protein